LPLPSQRYSTGLSSLKRYEKRYEEISAGKLEKRVWEAVSGLLKAPERLRAGLDAMLEQERAAWRGNPGKETELWAGKLAEAERMRRSYQEQAAKGYMTLRKSAQH
jgi:hypothetical protein